MKSTFISRLTVASLAPLAVGLTVAAPVAAGRLADGTVAFDRPPTLVGVSTLTSTAGANGRYHFTITVPADAGEPLEAVRITPYQHVQTIPLDLKATQAAAGAAFAQGTTLPLANVGGTPEDANEALVVFEQPVTPGNTVTITLEAERNPAGGVYQYGVTAYPAGENSVGQFLGYGRLSFYGYE